MVHIKMSLKLTPNTQTPLVCDTFFSPTRLLLRRKIYIMKAEGAAHKIITRDAFIFVGGGGSSPRCHPY